MLVVFALYIEKGTELKFSDVWFGVGTEGNHQKDNFENYPKVLEIPSNSHSQYGSKLISTFFSCDVSIL